MPFRIPVIRFIGSLTTHSTRRLDSILFIVLSHVVNCRWRSAGVNTSVRHLLGILKGEPMSNNYKRAEQEARWFFEHISAEADALNAKINSYADRMGRITKRENPAEFDAIIKGSAADLELFAQRIEALLPDYTRNLELLTEGFAETVKSLDPATDAGAQELEGMRREARALTETARGVKAKVTTLRNIFATLRDAN